MCSRKFENLKLIFTFLSRIKKIIVERRTIDPPIFLFPFNFSRGRNIIPRVIFESVHLHVCIQRRESRDARGSHFAPRGNSKPESYQRCFRPLSVHSRLLPVAGETENVERQTVFRFKRANGFLWIHSTVII